MLLANIINAVVTTTQENLGAVVIGLHVVSASAHSFALKLKRWMMSSKHDSSTLWLPDRQWQQLPCRFELCSDGRVLALVHSGTCEYQNEPSSVTGSNAFGNR
jgi:hypothetical protein